MRASDIKKGQAVIIDGKLYVVVGADHNTAGQPGAPRFSLKMRDVGNGKGIDLQDKPSGRHRRHRDRHARPPPGRVPPLEPDGHV